VIWRISSALLLALPWWGSWVHAGAPVAAAPCSGLSQATRLGHWSLDFLTTSTVSATLALPANRAVLLEAAESGADVTVEVTTNGGAALRADNPIRRSGVQRLLIRTGPDGSATLVARVKGHSGSRSPVYVQAFDAQAAALSNACRAVISAIAGADEAYAKARLISTGRSGAPAGSAADLYALARQKYEWAFNGLSAVTELPLRAELAHAITAVLYQDLEQWRESEQWSQRAAALFKASGNGYGLARSQSLQAAAWIELATAPNAGTATEATRHDSQVLLRRAEVQLDILARFHQARGELFDAGLQRNDIGIALYYGGAYEAAIRAYAQALPAYKKVGYTDGLAQTTQNMAVAEWDLGRVTAALGDYERALHLINVDDSPKLYAAVLNNCGLANRTAGHLDLALLQHAQALELTTRIQAPQRQAESLFGIAMVYSAAGDQGQAAQFLREALGIWAKVAEPRSQVGGLRALALIEAQQGRDAEAIRLERAALQLATDPATRIRLLVQIADSESRLAQVAAASEDLSLASRIATGADPVSRAAVDLERGVLEFRAGHLDSARRFTHAALAADRALGLEAPTFDAIVSAARIEASAGRSAAALRYLDAGLKLSEALRVQALDPELRATSMQPLRPAYDLEVQLWVQRYQQSRAAADEAGAEHAARAALAVTERSRVRAMQDIALANYAGAPAAVLAPLLAHKTELIRDIAAHEYRLEEDPTQSGSAGIQIDISHLREQLALVDSRLAALGGSAAQPDAVETTLTTRPLPADTALVSYWLGAAQSYAWIMTRSAVHLVNLGATDALRGVARNAHAAFGDLSTRSVEDRVHADEELSQLALRPVLSQLPAGIVRLVVIPDGPLHYVSFAALPLRSDARDSYLVRQYELAYGSSIGSLLKSGVIAKPTDNRMLLVADAVYGSDDPRLPGRAGEAGPAAVGESPRLRSALLPTALDRLPATAAEATAIAGVAAQTGLDRLEGFAATRAAVLGEPLERYRYIHFAVHATTDARIPQLSALVFSTYDPKGYPIENRVWAGDLMTRRFNATTVVLSACDTALGTDIGGEGLLGLRYVLLARGAQAVVASLWEVPDRATGTLMQSFYRGLLQEHRRPESALALAMRQSMRAGPRDPAFWAGFTTTVASLN
jgi:CHAT domain-containing protein